MGGPQWPLKKKATGELGSSQEFRTRSGLCAPELALVAALFCCAHPTEAPRERAFSAQGIAQSKRRASLLPKAVVDLLCVRMNTLALEGQQPPSAWTLLLDVDELDVSEEAGQPSDGALVAESGGDL